MANTETALGSSEKDSHGDSRSVDVPPIVAVDAPPTVAQVAPLSPLPRIKSGDGRLVRLWNHLTDSEHGSKILVAIIGALGLVGAGWWIQVLTNRYHEEDVAAQLERTKIDRQQAAAEEAFKIIGAARATSDDLIDLTSPPFNRAGSRPSENSQITRAQTAFNDASTAWRTRRLDLGYKIRRDRLPSALVDKAWDSIESATSNVIACSEGWYSRWRLSNDLTGVDTKDACTTERTVFAKALKELEASLAR